MLRLPVLAPPMLEKRAILLPFPRIGGGGRPIEEGRLTGAEASLAGRWHRPIDAGQPGGHTGSHNNGRGA